MFLGKLFDFQEAHEENLLKKCATNSELILSAPTGSGKTVLACKFIDDYLDENPNTVFLWLCPGAGGLQKQSQESFDELISGLDDGDVYDFISESDPSNKVYFINWDKINKSSNVVLREGEEHDLLEKVADCHRNGIEIFMLIDEEHKYQETADHFVNIIAPSHILRISATPITQGTSAEVISDDEAISAGLIASSISINEGVSDAVESNNNLDDDLLLIDLANNKRKQIQEEYMRLGLNIRPLVLIQFPSGSAEWISRVKEELANLGYGENSGLVASWFCGDHPDNPEEIKKLNGQYSFLLFKQAIATGWDCPRAKILVKLREGGTEIFNIQTIGRIRRMPERKHYDNELLDRCYVYTLDGEFQEGLTDSITDSFYSYLYKEVNNPPYLTLPKEFLDGSDRFTVNPKKVVEILRKEFLTECDINTDGKLSRAEMVASKGFVFDTKLKATAIEGIVRTTREIRNLNKIFGGEHQINIHDDGFIIRDAKRRIAGALKIDENISSNALRILFDIQDKQTDLFASSEDSKYESDNKLISDLSHREYCAFLVNNRDKLIAMFSKINASSIVDTVPTPTKKTDWHIPFEQYFKQHKKTSPNFYLKKSLYQKYGDNILVKPNRSTGEIEFEMWCEKCPTVSWVYRNGNKGVEFFSIVYHMALRRANFYPDYIIILKNGDIWIVEVKGGQKANGETENIDIYARSKFEALKDYVSEVNISNLHFGFVRYMGSQLYLSNTEWVDDLNDRNYWLPIEVFIK